MTDPAKATIGELDRAFDSTLTKSKEADMDLLGLDYLRSANIARDKEWDPDKKITLSFRAIELAGEVGELLNVVKKMLREQIGLRGSRVTKSDLAEELADVVICADLLAMTAEVDLAASIIQKFNATSDKHKLSVKLVGGGGPQQWSTPVELAAVVRSSTSVARLVVAARRVLEDSSADERQHRMVELQAAVDVFGEDYVVRVL